MPTMGFMYMKNKSNSIRISHTLVETDLSNTDFSCSIDSSSPLQFKVKTKYEDFSFAFTSKDLESDTKKVAVFSDNEVITDNSSVQQEFEEVSSSAISEELPNNALVRPETAKIIDKIIPSIIVSIGTGIAMMPIFNNIVKNLDQFGIDIHDNEKLFITSTANTFIVSSLSSFSNTFHYIKKYHGKETNINTLPIILSKIAASWSVILPLGLLWTIELENQEIAKSQGFDKFIIWATVSTIPLIADRVMESIKAIDEVYSTDNKYDLSTTGSKLFIYGLSGLSIMGRALAYTEITKTMGTAIGLNDTVALSVGIMAGGVLGSGGIAVFEHQAVKSLFSAKSEPWNIKKIIVGSIAALEGSWFSLPIVALGLKATENWNPLLKGLLLGPLFLSHSILEGTKLYDNVMLSCETIYDAAVSIMGDHYEFHDDNSFEA